jgi:hypothetical protein
MATDDHNEDLESRLRTAMGTATDDIDQQSGAALLDLVRSATWRTCRECGQKVFVDPDYGDNEHDCPARCGRWDYAVVEWSGEHPLQVFGLWIVLMLALGYAVYGAPH